MKIDLHTHTSLGSGCSVITPRELMVEAIRVGLDGLVITEHDNFGSAEVCRRIGQELGLAVFVGIECWTHDGHVLAFGVQPPYFADGGPVSLKLAVQWIREQNGAAVIAHPFRIDGISPGARLEQLTESFDAVEVVNSHNDPAENEPAIALCQRLGLVAVAGSDTHSFGSVGRAYTQFEATIDSDAALAEAIRAGACTPVGLTDGVCG
jgi:predicted metal-dependent phosphoesterase TrpH